MKKRLSKLKKKKSLVSIRRDDIDGNRIQGFILAYSSELILIQYVYDFTLDGLMILRLSDITEIGSDKTDIFQTRILKKEGQYSKVEFENNYTLKGWESVFTKIADKYRFVITEDEEPSTVDSPTFTLGEVVKVGRKSVTIHGFTGIARWHNEPTKIRFKNITSFQVGNKYSKTYERYFERNALTRPSSGHSR